MKAPQHRDRWYRSSEVAKILGVSSRTLYRMLTDGRIDEPMRDPRNGYRVWTEVDVSNVRESLKEAIQK